MTTHELKTWPRYFSKVITGEKTFEMRINDRSYQVGDVLVLKEWSEGGGYTGREHRCRVTYVADNSVAEELRMQWSTGTHAPVVMAISPPPLTSGLDTQPRLRGCGSCS